jgi:chemotaxis protein methyltransferase CheR
VLEHKISIAEQKRIINLLYENSGYDFRNYNSSIIKHRIDLAYRDLKIRSADDLCLNIENSENFRDKLLRILYITGGEILRDPSTLSEIKNTALKKLRKRSEINVWLPFCTGGEELHSLRIILNEADLAYKAKILAFAPTAFHKEMILNAKYGNKHINSLEKNLEVMEDSIMINRYFSYGDHGVKVNTEMFEDKLRVEVSDFFKTQFQSEFDLVFFRNKLLAYNKNQHFAALQKLTDSLGKSGYLILGVNENIGKTIGAKYKVISKNEPIYKKIVY